MKIGHIAFVSVFVGLCVAGTVASGQDVHDRINVKDYVDRSTNKVDQTEAIRQAIADAGKNRSWTLYFPPGSYAITNTIDISEAGLIIGENARIGQRNPEKDIFYSKSSWRKTIRGLGFYGGRDQIALGNNHTSDGFFVISECSFNDAHGAALRFYRVGEGEHGLELDMGSSFALVEKCTFAECDQVLIAMSDGTVLRDCWISTRPKQNNRAVIENYGMLTCENILGVPRVSSTDQRWIDNCFGSVVCRNFRFGGEGGGFTPVVNFAKYGSVTLEGGCCYALGNNKRACAVYCEEIPSSLVIHSGGSVPPVKINPKIDVQADLNSRQGQLVFDVADYDHDTCSGTLPKELTDAVAHRKVKAIEYDQLSAAETEQSLAKAVAEAKKFPSAPPADQQLQYTQKMMPLHKQQTDPAKWIDITTATNPWDLSGYMDATKEKLSDYLAVAQAGDNIVIMNRIEGGCWPHVLIKNVNVDLDKTPWLTWRLKDNGNQGSDQVMAVINNATEEMVKYSEPGGSKGGPYHAVDLRQTFGIQHGKLNVDLRYYVTRSSYVPIKKGDYVLIDFIRLEAEQ